MGWGGESRALGGQLHQNYWKLWRKFPKLKMVCDQNTGMKTYWANSNNCHSKSPTFVSSFLSYLVAKVTNLLYLHGRIFFCLRAKERHS